MDSTVLKLQISFDFGFEMPSVVHMVNIHNYAVQEIDLPAGLENVNCKYFTLFISISRSV